MKVIIRDIETGLYANGPASWAGAQSEALGFKNSIAALEFCVAHKIHDVEILLLDPQVGLPLRLFPREPLGAGAPAFAERPSAAALAGA